jgi:hypothetical protein
MRECGPGKRSGRKTGTAPWADFHHRLFSFISINWRGRPLTEYQVVIETIAATTNSGLTIEAVLDQGTYPTKVKVSNAQMRAVPSARQAFHGEWNYTVHCGPIAEPVQNKAIRPKVTK